MPVEEPRTASDEHTVITLCGSMRFREEFERLDAELSLAGHVVLTPAALDPSTEVNASERARLGRIHLQKIAMSDEVLVVQREGIGLNHGPIGQAQVCLLNLQQTLKNGSRWGQEQEGQSCALQA